MITTQTPAAITNLVAAHGTIEIEEVQPGTIDAYADDEWIATIGTNWDDVLAAANTASDNDPDIAVNVTAAGIIRVSK